jgi:hypothetical protein
MACTGIFERLQSSLVAVCLLSDADDDLINPPRNYDQAPGGWDALAALPV